VKTMIAAAEPPRRSDMLLVDFTAQAQALGVDGICKAWNFKPDTAAELLHVLTATPDELRAETAARGLPKQLTKREQRQREYWLAYGDGRRDEREAQSW